MDKNHVLLLIAEGEIYEAIKMILIQEQNIDVATIIAQSARFSLAKSFFKLGLIEYKDFEITANKVIHNITEALVSKSE